jgi:hypothetical protein
MTILHLEEGLFVQCVVEKDGSQTMVDGIRYVAGLEGTDSGGPSLDVLTGGRGFYMLQRPCGSALLTGVDCPWGHGLDGIALRGGSSGILCLVVMRYEGGRRFRMEWDWHAWAMVLQGTLSLSPLGAAKLQSVGGVSPSLRRP